MSAIVYILEYHSSLTQGVQAPKAPPMVVQTPIIASGASQSSQPFSGTLVMVKTDGGGPINLTWGSPPVTAVAGAGDHSSANQERWRTVTPGDVVAIIVSPA